MIQRHRWILSSLPLLVAGAIFSLIAVGRFFANMGWLAFKDQVVTQARQGTSYPLYQIIDPSIIQVSQAWLERAAAINGGDRVLPWQLGRLALASGEVEEAANWLAPLAVEQQTNVLLDLDRLAALSLAGRYEEVLTSGLRQSLPDQLLSRPVRAAIDRQAIGLLQEGEPDALERARVLRPDDLYVNFRLWEQAQSIGNAAATETYRQAIVRFAREAVDPADEGVLDYVASVVPELRINSLWDREQTRRVMAYLVWQHPHAMGVERLLSTLTASYPDEAEWGTYLAELHERQAGPVRGTVSIPPLYDEQAERQFAAEQLGVSVDQIELGPEMVNNGRFEAWTAARPTGWRFYQYVGNVEADGLYLSGQEALGPNRWAARLDTLRGGSLNDGTVTFGEYIGQEFSVIDQPYVVSLVYRSQSNQGSIVLFVSEYFRSGGAVLLNQGLPDTGGQWQLVQFMIAAPSGQISVYPVLRNWGIGQVSLAGLSIRSVAVRN